MWTKERLKETIQTKMGDYLLVAASNRQPYGHILSGGKVICRRQPGGLVTALNPVMQAVKGLWVGVGTTAEDRHAVDGRSKVMVPPENPSYALKRIFLTKQQTNAYYHGYSNEGMWPLCHVAFTRPQFLASDWAAYQQVNRMFADAILEEVGSQRAFVWVQDYHLILLAKYLRESGRSNIITSLFWHIPWPNPEIFRVCPQKIEILEGLLSFDLIGFHLRYDGENFLATVDREFESRIDRERMSVSYKGRETLVRAFPISVDFEAISRQAGSKDGAARGKAIRESFSLEDRRLIVGVDRIDYTKGIPERFKAFDRFLEKYPEYLGKVTLFQIGQVSRLHVPRYKQLNDELNALVEEINWKHGQGSWSPIVLTRNYMPYEDILAVYQAADVCVVSSLHDGMNLVAKEFAAARTDEDGVLVLSQFTGAARELTEALLVNPFDQETFADAFAQALSMPEEERKRRMRRMRSSVGQNNIFRWAGKALSELLKFEFQEG
jgi:trehalose 6-phosphate synthase